VEQVPHRQAREAGPQRRARARHGEAAPEASRARAARQIPATALEEAASSASPPRPSAHALVFAIQIRGRVWWRLGSGVGGERWEGARGGSDAGRRRWKGVMRGGLRVYPFISFFSVWQNRRRWGSNSRREALTRGPEGGGRGWRSDVRDDPKNIGRWMGMSPSWKSCGSLISIEVDFCVCLFGCTKIFLLSRGRFLCGRSLI